MSQNTFSMAGGVARNPLVRLAKPVTATIGADEHIAIVGPNGSGKRGKYSEFKKQHRMV